MSGQKNAAEGSHWGKTSSFSHKNITKRSTHISKDDKERFFNDGILPKIKSRSEKFLQKKSAAIQTDLLPDAIRVLNRVREEFGNDGCFIEAAYGKRIGACRASEVIHNYLVEHGIDGMMSVYFSTELDCSGKMSWTGPMNKYNLPEKRNYSMWVKNTSDNMYLRETGILSLTNHEIGTHFLRSFNDGLQPWYANRSLFGIGQYKSQALKDTEEGLASINTTFESKVKYLWGPAILYYAACKSLELNFNDLFEDLHKYVADREIRWKYVVRVKRGRNLAQLGGHGKDQCYFRGAVSILRNVESIDFNLLYAGKITIEDQCRIQRIARMECIKTPYFLKNMINYKRHLRNLLKVNGISKSKTALIKEPHIKLPSAKTSEHCPAQNKLLKKKQSKKEMKCPVSEARQRILSSKTNIKYNAFLTGSEEKIEASSSNDEDIITNADNRICTQLENSTLEDEEKSTHSLSPLVQTSKEAPTNSQTFSTLYLTNRRKTDTYAFSFLSNSAEEDFDDIEEDSDGIGHVTEYPVRELIPQTVQSVHPCFTYYNVEKQINPERYECDMVLVEKNADKNIPVASSIDDCVLTPSGKFCTSADMRLLNEEIEPCKDPHLNTVEKSKYIAKLNSPRETNISKTRKPTIASSEIHVTRKRFSISETPQCRQRTYTEKSIASSSTSSKSRKGLKKKMSTFFSDLIPFSRSRRKRVLPLPVTE